METEPYALRRKRLDHERYIRAHEERLLKQREYYQQHKEHIKLKVKECRKKRVQRELEKLRARKA